MSHRESGIYFTSQTFLLNKIKIKVKVKIYIFDISHPIGTWPILLYSLNERIAPDTNLTKNSKWQDNEQRLKLHKYTTKAILYSTNHDYIFVAFYNTTFVITPMRH